jgi:hypothetical protein
MRFMARLLDRHPQNWQSLAQAFETSMGAIATTALP